MKPVVISTLLSFVIAMTLGMFMAAVLLPHPLSVTLSVWHTPAFTAVTTLAGVYSLLINGLFFFIRRWNGCIEKLGGFTFTLFLWLASLSLVWILKDFLSPQQLQTTLQLTAILTVQLVGTGTITTLFLRTKNYDPKKTIQK